MLRNENIGAAAILIHILQLVGLWYWPCDANRHPVYRSLRRWHPLLLHGPITFIFVPLMALEVLTVDSLEQAVNLLPLTISELAMLFKFHLFWRNHVQNHTFIDELAENPVFRLHRSELAFWQRKESRFLRLAYMHMASCGLVFVILLYGMLHPYNYELLFPYYVVFDWHNPRTCWLVYIYEVLGLTLTCITNITMDMMSCYFIFHLSMLYELIGVRMKALRYLKEIEVVKELRSIWHLHQQVRKMSKYCELFISTSVLAQIVVNAVILGFTIYNLHSVSFYEDPSKCFVLLQFVCFTTLQIFLPCYYANQLTVASEGLLNSLYSCNWEEYSAPTRKSIILYMEFLKIPVKIRAGNFFTLGLPLFSKTMNNAYSMLALLLNMDETKDAPLTDIDSTRNVQWAK